MSASQFARPPHINSGFLKVFHLLYSILSSLVNEDWFKTHTVCAMSMWRDAENFSIKIVANNNYMN
jgi:hypothetical protein